MNRFSKIIKKLIKWGILLVVLAVGGTMVYRRFIADRISPSAAQTVINTAEVETRDIQNVLSSSGSIEPLNYYEVTTLAEGEVIAADFEEGDTVEEGQVLYQLTTDTLDGQIETAQTAVTRAEEAYNKAREDYQEALETQEEAEVDYEKAAREYGDTEVAATESGIVKSLFVKVGDTIQKGSQIAEIYDNGTMLLVVPFSASDTSEAMLGKTAEIEIEDSFESIEGIVTGVSSIEETLSGNRLVKRVTIEVPNPGGLTEQTKATAAVGDIYSTDAGIFSVKTNTVITSGLSGKIAELNLEAGGTVKEGDTVLKISQASIDDQLQSYSKAVENALDNIDNVKDALKDKEEALEDAKASLQEVIDTRTDYSITAPVTGKVIRKDALVGDTISRNSSLCVIYDLSAVKFSMYVDELDVMKVKVGQEVDITADALEGVEISGIVTNISLESTSSQGVTQYPVTVRIDETGELLPGMNVTGEIIIEKAEGVLAIPSDALMRGDVVYVRDAAVTEASGDIPAGFRSVEVTTGITDGDYIEITGGLTGDEEVYIQRTTASGAFPGGMMFNFSGEGSMGGGNFTPGSGNFRSGGGGSRSNSGGSFDGGGMSFPGN